MIQLLTWDSGEPSPCSRFLLYNLTCLPYVRSNLSLQSIYTCKALLITQACDEIYGNPLIIEIEINIEYMRFYDSFVPPKSGAHPDIHYTVIDGIIMPLVTL